MIQRLIGYNKHPPVILTILQLPSSQTEKIIQPSIDTGIPEVTLDQALAFVTAIIMKFYEFAVEISPQITLFTLIIGGIAGIFLNWARKAVLWAILGMLLILWGPQLISFLSNFKIN